MKFVFRSFLAMAAVAMLAGCSKDDNNGPAGGGSGGGGPATGEWVAQFTLNGDGYDNEAFTFFDDDAEMLYNNVAGATVGTCSVPINEDDSRTFQVMFPGNTTGTWTCNTTEEDCDDALFLIVYLVEKSYMGHDYTVTVTEFGPVDGKIKGTFSGTLRHPTDHSITVDVVGQFQFKRYPDYG